MKPGGGAPGPPGRPKGGGGIPPRAYVSGRVFESLLEWGTGEGSAGEWLKGDVPGNPNGGGKP